MLSKGVYHGELYDIGYDYPETHCIEKDSVLYYAFFNPDFNGTVELRGLDANKKYSILDYVHHKKLGTLNGSHPVLKVSFQQNLLIEVKLSE